MSPLRIGFIGTGGIGNHHAQGLRQLPERFSLLAASDTHAPALHRFCTTFSISRSHADYRRILDDPDIDAVIVLLPHHLHAQVCIEAFAAGKHVLVEKPIARTLDEADRIIAAAKHADRTLMVGHNQRFDHRHRQVKRKIDAGELGHIFQARIDHYQNFNPPRESWWRSRTFVGGGCVIGSGVHRLDLLRWFLGEAVEITSELSWDPSRLEGEVACSSIIRFDQGAIAQFQCNWGIHRCSHGESLGMYGVDGSIEITGDAAGTSFLPPQHQPVPLDHDVGESMWGHFHHCVVNQQQPLTSGAEGRATLALVLDVVRSGELKQKITLASPPSSRLAARSSIA